MKLRLYIGMRRYRAQWISIDDIFQLDGEKEILIACKGAKALLDNSRQSVAWKLLQENRIFVGNIWEGEIQNAIT